MRPAHKFTLAFACVSFLTITLSGFHAHADIGDHDESVPRTHDHHPILEQGQDHEEEHVDISVFEPGRGFSKVEMLALMIAVPEHLARPPAETCWSKDLPDLAPKLCSRMRQPPRGPPISL
jgi:hypothetical protein